MGIQPQKDFGENEAKRHIDIYRAELAAMAAAAMQQYSNLDPPGAVICEPGTSEGTSLIAQLDPKHPIREVEGGICLAVMPRADLRALMRGVAPGADAYLDRAELAGPGKLPILAVCKRGSLMGTVDLPELS